MRKMISVLLVCCMLCGLHAAVAEEAGFEMGGAAFSLPDELSVGLEPLDLLGVELCKMEAADYYVWMVAVNHPKLKNEFDINLEQIAEEYSITKDEANKVICSMLLSTVADNFFGGLYPQVGTVAQGASGNGGVIGASYSTAEAYYLNLTGTRGWTVLAVSETGDVSAKELQTICVNILLSIEENTTMVVITADSASVRKEASLSGAMIRKAAKGECFEYLGEEGNFYIVMIDGQQGYVAKGVAEIQ